MSRSPDVKIREPMNLYKKPMSIVPEVNDTGLKPIGAGIKGKIDMGTKYPDATKTLNPEPKDFDANSALGAVKPKVAAISFGNAIG